MEMLRVVESKSILKIRSPKRTSPFELWRGILVGFESRLQTGMRG